IYELVHALARLEAFQFPVELNAVSREFFTQTAALETPAVGTAMRAIVANPGNSPASAVLSADPRYNSMLRTTCVATRLAGGHAYNALPQTASANINCRIVPTQTPEQVRATLSRVFSDTGVRITETVAIHEKSGAAPSPLTAEIMTPVTEITHSMFGANVPVVPVMSTGATDGRFLRASGIPTYGVSGLFGDPADSRAHGRDERMLVKSLHDGQEFLSRLVHRLADNK
ncbi:MAG: M20/M25/M40 family metallo-hydrolase, partial [Gemmatimonadota bacterium]|nr:M20/M25/M40 family metallo-hydrolase [Gemmatimonadota bacterium]